MKKMLVLLAALLCLGCSACAQERPGVGEPEPPPPAPVSTSLPEPEAEPLTPEADYALYISDQPIPIVQGCLTADRLPVRFINNTGEDGYVLDIPHLERRDDAGVWTEVPWEENVGFCGTPSSLPADGREWSEDLLYLWGPLEDGVYRLYYQVGPDARTEDRAYGEFTLCTLEDKQRSLSLTEEDRSPTPAMLRQ